MIVGKYTLDPAVETVQMRRGARVLHVHEQHGDLCVWAEADIDQPIVRRRLHAVPTGAPVSPADVYVGTAHLANGALVFHVYDGGES